MIQIRSVCISAHLDSFCSALAEQVGESFEFIYLDQPGEMRKKIGWQISASYKNMLDDEAAKERAHVCDVLVIMEREFDIVETRLKTGKKTFYISERWLKPIRIRLPFKYSIVIPGIFRIFNSRYRKMVRRFMRFIEDENFYVLPIGIHAVCDFVRLKKIFSGKLFYLFMMPKVKVEKKLGGLIEEFPRMRLWSYFVASSQYGNLRRQRLPQVGLRILWCGRMLDWKRVDVLVKAVKKLRRNNNLKARNAELLLIGDGPELKNLKHLAKRSGFISFEGYRHQTEIRELMRKADVYVMPSNAEEGWGAAVSDALSEGCPVISTFEAGSSATLLSNRNLYHASSVNELTSLLLKACNGEVECADIRDWSGKKAAKIFMDLVNSR